MVAAIGDGKIVGERLTPCRRFPTAAPPFARTPVEIPDVAPDAWRVGFERGGPPFGSPARNIADCRLEETSACNPPSRTLNFRPLYTSGSEGKPE
jgi:hypothetical protein